MANKKITELPEAFTVDGTEYIEIVQGGVNKKARLSLVSSVGLHWVHIGDWDLSADTLPSDAVEMNTYLTTAIGNINFGDGDEEIPLGSLLVFLGGDNQDGANWYYI